MTQPLALRDALVQLHDPTGPRPTPPVMERVALELFEGQGTPALVGAFLASLAQRGETPADMAAFAGIMKAKATAMPVPDGWEPVDLCGTGGDHAGTFNISTAASFVVAAAGVPVAKHGNRAASSKCGSADVLEALGVEITAVPERMRVALAECRICFMFAQVYHSAMRHVAPIRRELGIRTIFNLLGPLTNPAGIKRQLVGVGSELAFDLYPETLRHLGITHALVVRGYGGLDEITPYGATRVREVTADGVKDYTIHPGDFGRPEYDLAGLAAGDSPEANALILREVLGGTDRGARREAVLYNAAAGLLVGGRVPDLAAGIALAEETIDSGEASRCLAAFVGATRPIDPTMAG